MEYRKHLSEPWFSLVYLKIKKVEGRLNKGVFKKLEVGDTITWFNNDFGEREFKTVVKSKKTYKSFRTYLKEEGMDKCLPSIEGIKNGEDVYYKYFSKEDEKKYGIVAIRLKNI